MNIQFKLFYHFLGNFGKVYYGQKLHNLNEKEYDEVAVKTIKGMVYFNVHRELYSSRCE